MTKRACPFEVGVLRQFKVHINNFECDKASLREMQNKTVEKLFSAQKKLLSPSINNNQEILPFGKVKTLKQKSVSNYIQCKNQNPAKESIVNNSIIPSSGLSNCSYCDSITDNVFKCNICNDLYCHACSFVDYNVMNDDVRICITCS
ncbi:UNVERIFIED_CONTAM: hypothetical protein PYX00_002283 [Menopon gallinae]|uniref:Apoptosis regulatory protein Siva n=1 Tax=Menopon gallinae TaxID=328185 RepID=A0AAW2IHF4_9NEOP